MGSLDNRWWAGATALAALVGCDTGAGGPSGAIPVVQETPQQSTAAGPEGFGGRGPGLAAGFASGPTGSGLKSVTLSGSMGGMSAEGWEINEERSFGYASTSEVSFEVHVEDLPRDFGMVGAWTYGVGLASEGDVIEFDEWSGEGGGIACAGPSPFDWTMDVGAFAGSLELVGFDADGALIVDFELDFGVDGHVWGTAVLGELQGLDPAGGFGFPGTPEEPPPVQGPSFTFDLFDASFEGGVGGLSSEAWSSDETQWSYADIYGQSLYLEMFLQDDAGNLMLVNIWADDGINTILGGGPLDLGGGSAGAWVCAGQAPFECQVDAESVGGSLQIGSDAEGRSQLVVSLQFAGGQTLSGTVGYTGPGGPVLVP